MNLMSADWLILSIVVYLFATVLAFRIYLNRANHRLVGGLWLFIASAAMTHQICQFVGAAEIYSQALSLGTSIAVLVLLYILTGTVTLGSNRAKDLSSELLRLQIASREWQQVWSSLEVGWVKTSFDTIMFEVNSVFAGFLGYTVDELTGKSFIDITPREDEQHAGRNLMDRMMDGEKQIGLFKRYKRKDGTLFPAYITVGRIDDDLGNPKHMIVQVRDMRNVKELELKIREASDQLLNRVAEVDRFTYVVSHELKHPIRAIVSFLQIVDRDRKKGRTDRIEDFHNRIQEAAIRMGQVLDDLSNLSQMSRVDPKIETVVVGELLASVLSDLSALTDGVDMEIATPKQLPTLQCCSTLLYQVLINLLSNAVKFRQPDIPLLIEIEYQDKGMCYEFSIRDNGRGMEMEKAGRLFEPFQRLSGTADVPGTGVGLAVCKRAVTIMGGEIWAESRGRNLGSTFYFTIAKKFDGS